ncbi:hypothetical protein JHK82_028059 [Glycine max]|nr:hypothetical protein JHK82_028059 [Glycine max]KAG5151836.1 hypothetical protein JHK84_028308 [Glycine max]
MSEVQAQQVEPKARESPTRKIPTLKTFQIYRWNPKNPSKHKVKDYQINLKEGGPMVLDALNNIQNKIDPSLTFRRSCREGICGSCAMNIDDYNNIACLTKIPLEKNSAAMTITPLPHILNTTTLHYFIPYVVGAFASTRVSNELGAGNPKRAKGVVRVVVILKVAEAVIVKQNYTTNCSALYWIMNLLQVPITIGTTFYEVVLLYKGQSVIASKGDQQTRWHVQQLILYCMCGIISGIIGGLLGLGGGFILGPLFIGLGIHPQLKTNTKPHPWLLSSTHTQPHPPKFLLYQSPNPKSSRLITVHAEVKHTIVADTTTSSNDKIREILGNHDYNKLGLPFNEQKHLANIIVDAVLDNVSIATTYRKTQEKVGVIF